MMNQYPSPQTSIVDPEQLRIQYSMEYGEHSAQRMIDESKQLLDDKVGPTASEHITDALITPMPELFSEYPVTRIERDGDDQSGYNGPLKSSSDGSEIPFKPDELGYVESMKSIAQHSAPGQGELAFQRTAQRYLVLRDALSEVGIESNPQLRERCSVAAIQRELNGNGLRANQKMDWSLRADGQTIEGYSQASGDYPAAVLLGFATALPSMTAE